MANLTPRYKVIGLTGGSGFYETTFRGAPSPNRIASWGKPRGVRMAVRYYPSKKGWMIIDLRRAARVNRHNGFGGLWIGIDRTTRVFPSEDAAVMVAVHLVNQQPSML